MNRTTKIWRDSKNRKRNIRLPNLEKTVTRIAAKTIDLGSTFKCVPYNRVNRKDHTSLELEFKSRAAFFFVASLMCTHSIAQWISFFYHIHCHGLNAHACLHLNFLAIYTISFIFSLELILHPDGMLNVQNRIQRTQKSFRKSWTHHPIIILVMGALRVFLFIVPLISLGLYLLDSTAPMFVVTSILKMEKAGMAITGYSTVKSIIAVLLELLLIFSSVLTISSVSQTCAIMEVALNIWMEDIRNRIKETKTLNSPVWTLFEKLYQRVQVFSILSNCFWSSIIIPGCTVLVVLLTISCLYCSLRLHESLHPLVYAFFPVLAVFMIGGVLFGVFGQLSKVNRNSHACVKDIAHEGKKLSILWVWNGDDRIKMACIGKKLETLRPFGVQSGHAGYITLSTQFEMLDQIINYLLLLLTL